MIYALGGARNLVSGGTLVYGRLAIRHLVSVMGGKYKVGSLELVGENLA